MASLGAERLDLSEAVPLGYALVGRVAQTAGIPALAVKGPTLAELGLRPDRTSLDVDVLVAPHAVPDLLAALEGVGWQETTAPGPSGGLLAPHSRIVRHDHWPVEIDVHLNFPGFAGSPEAVFDVLWSERVAIPLAGQLVDAPSRAASACIALLHVSRSGERRARELGELVQRLETVLDSDERREVARIARATGAAGALADVLERLHVPFPADGYAPVSPGWDLQTRASGVRTLGWLLAFREAPRRTWPGLAWRALWLSEAELRVRYPGARPGVAGIVRMWLARWGSGLRSMPHAVHLLRDDRHRRKAIAPDRTAD